MNTIESLRRLLKDDRLGARHICVYLALLKIRQDHKYKDAFLVHRQTIMPIAKIYARSTYYRLLRELKECGYIEYWPSYSYKGRCRIKVS